MIFRRRRTSKVTTPPPHPVAPEPVAADQVVDESVDHEVEAVPLQDSVDASEEAALEENAPEGAAEDDEAPDEHETASVETETASGSGPESAPGDTTDTEDESGDPAPDTDPEPESTDSEPEPEPEPEPGTDHLPSHGVGHLAHTADGDRPTGAQVTVDEHLARVLAGVPELPAHPQPLMDTLGAAAAEEVRAEVALPGFDNSAMDGYAVRAADCAEASTSAPVVLPVVGENSAGRTGLLAMSKGTAVKVMTGAPIPQGADAVVPYEVTDRGVARVAITQAPRVGAHIRRAGEDVAVGDLVIHRGAVIGPRQVGLLAGVGRSRVLTRPRPRVVVLSTGSELRDPGTPVGRDAIHDANSYLLAAAVRAAGAIAYRVGIVPDEPRAFRDALSDQLVRADLVITSGGVSQGDHDVVKAALREHEDIWFGTVGMQPGKPQGFGVVGEDRTPIFTLPGNPVSAYVSFQVFVLPALRKMMGLTPHVRPLVRATLGAPLTSAPGKRQFVRGRFEVDRGRSLVTPVGGHGSHLLGDLAVSNALIVLGEQTTEAAVGEQVDVLLFDEEH